MAQRPENDDETADEHEGYIDPEPDGLAEDAPKTQRRPLCASSVRQQDRPSNNVERPSRWSLVPSGTRDTVLLIFLSVERSSVLRGDLALAGGSGDALSRDDAAYRGDPWDDGTRDGLPEDPGCPPPAGGGGLMGRFTAAGITDQSGRSFLVTGANSGLGYETARQLAAHGARVLLTTRSEEKGLQAVARLKAEIPDADVRHGVLDLADLESVRAFAAAVSKEGGGIDVLVNNAGVMFPPRVLSRQGNESQFATNHLGHFALTGLLFETIRRGRDARVVTVSSVEHKGGSIHFQDLTGERAYCAAGVLSAVQVRQRALRSGARPPGEIGRCPCPLGARPSRLVQHEPPHKWSDGAEETTPDHRQPCVCPERRDGCPQPVVRGSGPGGRERGFLRARGRARLRLSETYPPAATARDEETSGACGSCQRSSPASPSNSEAELWQVLRPTSCSGESRGELVATVRGGDGPLVSRLWGRTRAAQRWTATCRRNGPRRSLPGGNTSSSRASSSGARGARRRRRRSPRGRSGAWSRVWGRRRRPGRAPRRGRAGRV